MDKLLRLYTYVDGGTNDTPFPNSDNPIEIGEFRYDAKRMGGAPTITASVYYPSCLDEVWTDNVYAEFNGEKYYLKQVPTSSYSNEDSRYKHDLELVSERVALDNVYFYDTVSDEAEGDDKPVSNSTKFVFHGDIHEFASRLGHSLAQSGLDYTVHVDDGVSSESLLVSFENAFFSNAIQEAYNTYNIPYYFVGKEIHFGLAGNNIEEVLSYGVDDALLSITKSNANYKVVNRVTGTGSSDNIPFYYPNNSPKGNIAATPSRDAFSVKIVDFEKFSDKVEIDESIRYEAAPSIQITGVERKNGDPQMDGGTHYVECDYLGYVDEYKIRVFSNKNANARLVVSPVSVFAKQDGELEEAIYNTKTRLYVDGKQVGRTDTSEDEDNSFELVLSAGTTEIIAYVNYQFQYDSIQDRFIGSAGISYSVEPIDSFAWYFKNKRVDLADFGVVIESGEENLADGDTITQTLTEYIKSTQVLMPYKYRQTKGAERFYNATNGTYTDENGDSIVFDNPYIAGRPKEHIITVEDIKPTIKETTVGGLRIDMFSEFAYDEGDNDETYEDEEGNVYFKHPYFYGKLRVMDFNLFDHAIEQQPMTISFTSGDCGACNFEIGVTEDYPQKNPVQVDADGNLIRDDKGMVVAGVEGTQQVVTTFQDRQQDTSKYEVWIALRKEEETYGILMPQVPHRPKACSVGQNNGDTFVILGINLPFSYVENAERKLEAEIVKYMKENNDEKFKFSIVFSRIYFEENPDVLALLNENSALKVSYNGRTYDLYVSSFSYSMSEGDVLPEIRVELDDTLQVTQNALQNAISEVKSQIGSVVREVNAQVAMQKSSYIQRNADDSAYGTVNFTKGLKFGEGGKVEVLENNSTRLSIEYLEVTKKATFTSLEIQEKTHAGGQILVTPASVNCGEVEELDDAYRCYFQTKGAEGGDEIFNQFAVGDQAICQTFNAWGSKYYWRLVTAVGEDYIDLSKEDCDEGSGVPEAGDKIIQLGNRVDEARQNAIVIAAYGESSPYIVQYKGISNYDLPSMDADTRVTTLLSPTKNILTGQVRMTAGSSGLELFDEWAAKQTLIDSKASGEDFDEFKNLVDRDIENIKNQVDGAITTWFYDDEPTLNNAPAVDWATDEDKNNHLGDLYYSGAGKAYRFQYDEATSAYYWNLITDEDITEALGLAQQAKDTADGKRRVFVVQPTPPYDEGDLWSRGSTLPMMVCVNTKTSGSFAEGDWDFADNAGQLAEQIAGYEYIKEAIQNGDTIVTGGLIQSGILMLGYTDEDGAYQVMSGTNGVYDANATGGGIAAWYGGGMSEDEAKTVLRFDGSGFFANKNITWDNEGGASFAGGKITITKEGALIFSDEIAFGSGEDETVASILEKLSTLLSYFTLEGDELTTEYQLRIKNNLIIQGDTSTGGTGSNPEVAGTLIGIKVNGQTYKDPVNGILTIPDYPTSLEWSAINGKPTKLSEFLNDSGFITSAALLGYATQSWVEGKGYITGIDKSMVASAVGSSGNAGKVLSSTGGDLGWVSLPTSLPASDVYPWAKKSSLALADVPDLSSKYLSVNGGTITTSSGWGITINSTFSTGSYNKFFISDVEKATVGYFNGMAYIANENSGYRIGVIDDGTPVYRPGWSSYPQYTLIHSGNYNSQIISLTNLTSLNVGDIATTDDGSVSWIYLDGSTKRHYVALNKENNNVYVAANVRGTIVLQSDAKVPQIMLNGITTDIIHSGSIGDYTIRYHGNKGAVDFNNELNNGLQYVSGSSSNGGKAYDIMLSTCISDSAWQLVGGRSGELRYRGGLGTASGWGSWKQIAFTDSNVASATQLATTRSIWGQNFNGTGDVSGSLANVRHIYMAAGYHIMMGDASVLTLDGNNLQIGQGVSGNTIIAGGNVTIGSSDLASTNHKLRVDGLTYLYANRSISGIDNALAIGHMIDGSNAKGNGVGITLGYAYNQYYCKIATVYESSSPDYLRPALAFYTMSDSYAAGSEVERMRITSSGNVGIGTTSPAYKLHLYSSSSSTGALFVIEKNGAYDARFELNNTVDKFRFIQQSTGNAFISLNGNHSLVFETSNTARMLITGGGNVGIGASNPQYKLDVNGNISFGNNDEGELYFQRPYYNRLIAAKAGGFFSWRVNGTTDEAMILSAGGNLLVGTTVETGSRLVVKQPNASIATSSTSLTLDSEWEKWGYQYNMMSFRFAGVDKATLGWNSVPLSVSNYAGFYLTNIVSGNVINLLNEGGIYMRGAVTMSSTLTVSGLTTINGNLVVAGDISA